MKKQDFILIGVVLAVVGILAFFLYFVNGDSGSYVQVEVDGKVVDTFLLSQSVDKQYDFNGETNTLLIKNGKVNVTEANCPDGICVNHRQIHRTGESIICLPHKFVVTVLDDNNQNDEIDAVA